MKSKTKHKIIPLWNAHLLSTFLLEFSFRKQNFKKMPEIPLITSECVWNAFWLLHCNKNGILPCSKNVSASLNTLEGKYSCKSIKWDGVVKNHSSLRVRILLRRILSASQWAVRAFQYCKSLLSICNSTNTSTKIYFFLILRQITAIFSKTYQKYWKIHHVEIIICFEDEMRFSILMILIHFYNIW